MIRLAKFTKEHLGKTFIWMQDQNLKDSFLLDRELNEKDHLMWYERLKMDKSQEIFAIYFEDFHVGNIGLKNIDLNNCKAECWIYIGDSSFKGKGLASKAMLALDQATTHALHKIYANIAENNTPSIKALLSAGYKVEALLHDEIKFKGKYINMCRVYKIL